jgi:hypothetical protein
MALRRIPYAFSIELPAPRPWAYRWATDYDAADFDLMEIPARRSVERLADDLYLLTDSFDADPFEAARGASSVKEKLVHLYPDRWSWISTHLSGPARGSQFIYELLPNGPGRSRFHYSGAQVEVSNEPSTRSTIARRAKTLRAEDVRLWRSLARAMGREYRDAKGTSRARR